MRTSLAPPTAALLVLTILSTAGATRTFGAYQRSI